MTGASAGLGAEFARQLAARGVHLVLTARREPRLRELSDELRGRHGIDAAVVAADLAEDGEASRLWREATAGARIDLLINNAGFGAQGSFHEIDLEQQLAMVRLNCGALLELAHHAVAHMRPRGGGIVNVSSLAGFQPVPTMATYGASKAFVLSLSEALHAENHASGVRVVALCPGRTPTEFQAIAGTGRVHEDAVGIRTPEQVVAAGLDALENDRGYVVPGAPNAVAAIGSRLAPRSLVMRVARKMVERRSARH